VDGGLSILQYADDTVLFLQHDLAKAANLKLLLITFEQVSGLKINYHKSELFGFGLTEEETFYLCNTPGVAMAGTHLGTQDYDHMWKNLRSKKYKGLWKLSFY
jgi:hypothetical protein